MISVEERQMALTEREFKMIERKMDKIDVRLNEMYQNWHAEYGSATSIEECEEIKNFYKPYMVNMNPSFQFYTSCYNNLGWFQLVMIHQE